MGKAFLPMVKSLGSATQQLVAGNTLLAAPGRVFSRNQLMDLLYVDHRVVSDRTVDSHVKNSRRKIVKAGGDEDWRRSIYGMGYKLEC